MKSAKKIDPAKAIPSLVADAKRHAIRGMLDAAVASSAGFMGEEATKKELRRVLRDEKFWSQVRSMMKLAESVV